MDAQLSEWLNLIARWVHVIAGIMWVGNSLLFNWLDRSLAEPKPGRDAAGEAWLLHSGGFYYVEKSFLRTAELPRFVHWFKWQSYTTWISGFLLLILVYYMSGGAFMVDPRNSWVTPNKAVAIGLGLLLAAWFLYDLFWRSSLSRNTTAAGILSFLLVVGVSCALCHLLSGRAAFLHVGAMLGTLMAGNVFFHIIPSQKELVASIKEGRGSDLALANRAKQRSIHNNYMTFPVIFLMISNHFGGIYGHKLNWLLLVILVLTSALIRHFMNIRFTYRMWLRDAAITIATAGVAIYLIMGPVFATKAAPSEEGAGEGARVTFAEAREIINHRCLSCHSIYPTDPALALATAGVHFDTPEEIKRYAERIRFRTTEAQTMPLANKTNITPEEREKLGRWVAQGARIP